MYVYVYVVIEFVHFKGFVNIWKGIVCILWGEFEVYFLYIMMLMLKDYYYYYIYIYIYIDS
jgi:hypothetical protein